tara:strand:+ start:3213 stop:3458 length:246 start_codon:yes stop_codon:yes gene_type:complete
MRKKRIYLYRECSQPETGWFKACFLCYTTTARTLLFDEVEERGIRTERLVYVCPECKRAMTKDEALRTAYEHAVSRYLARH